MKCLVNEELPTSGMSESTKDYRKNLEDKGYNRYQAAGSLGGAIHGKSVSIVGGKVTRN